MGVGRLTAAAKAAAATVFAFCEGEQKRELLHCGLAHAGKISAKKSVPGRLATTCWIHGHGHGITARQQVAERGREGTLDAAGHVLGPVLALAVVKHLLKRHFGTLAELVPVRDRGKVAEDVIAAVVGLDEAETTVIPAGGDAGHLASTASAAAVAGGGARAPAWAAAAGPLISRGTTIAHPWDLQGHTTVSPVTRAKPTRMRARAARHTPCAPVVRLSTTAQSRTRRKSSPILDRKPFPETRTRCKCHKENIEGDSRANQAAEPAGISRPGAGGEANDAPSRAWRAEEQTLCAAFAPPLTTTHAHGCENATSIHDWMDRRRVWMLHGPAWGAPQRLRFGTISLTFSVCNVSLQFHHLIIDSSQFRRGAFHFCCTLLKTENRGRCGGPRISSIDHPRTCCPFRRRRALSRELSCSPRARAARPHPDRRRFITRRLREASEGKGNLGARDPKCRGFPRGRAAQPVRSRG